MTTTRAAASRRGAGAAPEQGALELGGRVDDDGFMALMEGRDPRTGEQLGVWAGARRWRRLT